MGNGIDKKLTYLDGTERIFNLLMILVLDLLIQILFQMFLTTWDIGGDLNLNQLIEGEYPMITTMGGKNGEMQITNVDGTANIVVLINMESLD